MRPQNPSAVSDSLQLANSVYKTLRANVSIGASETYDAGGTPASFTQDNGDGVMVRVASSANPFSLPNYWAGSNTDTVIPHNLNRVPIGYYTTSKSVAADVYTGSAGQSAWTDKTITLRSTVGTADIVVYIF